MKKIVLTGGGTAGHVTPNIALIPSLKEAGYDIHYIGTYNGIEKNLIKDTDIPYYGIASGKLRRYLDIKNFTDPFRIIKGCFQASQLIKKIKPDIIFSKGGFVTVPVVLAGKLNGVPTLIHESDMTPGLANKLSIPLSTKVCVTFPNTLNHLPKNKGILTGTPIRKEILTGNKEKGLTLCKFSKGKPTLMMIGGSLGAKSINKVLREALPKLLQKYQLVHLCGKGNYRKDLEHYKGYKQFEYVKEDLPHLFDMADVIISRAGANSINELLALKKPNVLIPLPLNASRGDQILNAKAFEEQGYSHVLYEEDMTATSLLQLVDSVYLKRNNTISAMEKSGLSNGIDNVIKLINQYSLSQ